MQKALRLIIPLMVLLWSGLAQAQDASPAPTAESEAERKARIEERRQLSEAEREARRQEMLKRREGLSEEQRQAMREQRQARQGTRPQRGQGERPMPPVRQRPPQ